MDQVYCHYKLQQTNVFILMLDQINVQKMIIVLKCLTLIPNILVSFN